MGWEGGSIHLKLHRILMNRYTQYLMDLAFQTSNPAAIKTNLRLSGPYSVLKPGPTRLVGPVCPRTRGCSGSGRLHDRN